MAFANMAAIETCFKRKTGVFGDYSEQQLVDCGYGGYGNGCNGAPLNAYFKWAADSKADLTAEVRWKQCLALSNSFTGQLPVQESKPYPHLPEQFGSLQPGRQGKARGKLTTGDKLILIS